MVEGDEALLAPEIYREMTVAADCRRRAGSTTNPVKGGGDHGVDGVAAGLDHGDAGNSFCRMTAGDHAARCR